MYQHRAITEDLYWIGVQIDRKRLAQLRQKRVALGHKPDDHELEQQQGFSMKFHM